MFLHIAMRQPPFRNYAQSTLRGNISNDTLGAEKNWAQPRRIERLSPFSFIRTKHGGLASTACADVRTQTVATPRPLTQHRARPPRVIRLVGRRSIKGVENHGLFGCDTVDREMTPLSLW